MLTRNDHEALVATYAADGVVQAPGFLPVDLMDDLRFALIDLCNMQARKLGLAVEDIDHSSIDGLDELVVRLNDRDRYALDHATRMLRTTSAGLRMAAYEPLAALCAGVLGAPKAGLQISGPSLFVNMSSKTIRMYTWHTEKYWYPKRRNFVNVWIPVFREKRTGNGTMAVLPGSFKGAWDYFSEYFGYDGASEGSADHNLQYEIPEGEIEGWDQRDVVAGAGEAVLFHPNTVHRSTFNTSGKPSYVVTVRVFDFRRDLTLSADWTESPYRLQEAGRTGGRFNLKSAV